MAETNLSPYWAAGTATLTAGSATVAGQSSTWLSAALRAGDQIESDAGERATILSIDSDTSITLDKPWRAATQTAKPYKVWRTTDAQFTMESARRAFGLLGSGGIQALSTLIGGADRYPMFTGPGTMTTVSKQDLIQGVTFDARVDNLAGRAVYNLREAGFTVLVSNNGDGRAAIYSKVSNANADWSIPAFITGSAVTLDITEVDEVPYGVPPAVVLTPKAGGYDLAFDIPRGMNIVPGATTTLAPDQPAAVTFVPVTGGYRLDIAIPRGPTGDINGVTPFWVTRLGSDATAAAARVGLGINDSDGRVPNGQLPLQRREKYWENPVADWDNAILSGQYSSINTAINAPYPSWWIADVANTDGVLIVQRFRDITAIAAGNSATYERVRRSGVWSAPYRLRLSEDEQRTVIRSELRFRKPAKFSDVTGWSTTSTSLIQSTAFSYASTSPTSSLAVWVTAQVENAKDVSAESQGTIVNLYRYTGSAYATLGDPSGLLFDTTASAGQVARGQLQLFSLLTAAQRRSDVPGTWTLSPYFQNVYAGNTAKIISISAIMMEIEP